MNTRSLSNLAFILCIFTPKTENFFVCGINCSLRESLSIYDESLNVSISKSVSEKLSKISFKSFLDLPPIFLRISSSRSYWLIFSEIYWNSECPFQKIIQDMILQIHTHNIINTWCSTINTYKKHLGFTIRDFVFIVKIWTIVVSEKPKDMESKYKELASHQFISALVTIHMVLTRSSLQ